MTYSTKLILTECGATNIMDRIYATHGRQRKAPRVNFSGARDCYFAVCHIDVHVNMNRNVYLGYLNFQMNVHINVIMDVHINVHIYIIIYLFVSMFIWVSGSRRLMPIKNCRGLS